MRIEQCGPHYLMGIPTLLTYTAPVFLSRIVTVSAALFILRVTRVELQSFGQSQQFE